LPSSAFAVIPGKALGHNAIGDVYASQTNSQTTTMPTATKQSPKHLPEWGVMPKRPGLYLSLNHGRDFPQQVMKDRGFPGPKIGPVLYVRTLYAQQVTLRFASLRDAKRFFPEATLAINTLEVIEGTLVFGDKCYGDWDVCFIAEEFCRRS
jgi:hypothetical protein